MDQKLFDDFINSMKKSSTGDVFSEGFKLSARRPTPSTTSVERPKIGADLEPVAVNYTDIKNHGSIKRGDIVVKLKKSSSSSSYDQDTWVVLGISKRGSDLVASLRNTGYITKNNEYKSNFTLSDSKGTTNFAEVPVRQLKAVKIGTTLKTLDSDDDSSDSDSSTTSSSSSVSSSDSVDFDLSKPSKKIW